MSNSVHTNPGALVISLDFELYWGLVTLCPLDSIQSMLLGTRKAIPRLLSLFQEYEARATWAVVSLLFYRSREDLLRNLPALRPPTNGSSPSQYDIIATVGDNESSDPYRYAESLVSMIASSSHQEIATHTFAHCVWNHETPQEDAFRADLKAAVRTHRKRGLRAESLVYPQNKYSAALIPLLREEGIVAYRGVWRPWYAGLENQGLLSQWLFRVCRFTDRHVGIAGEDSVSWETLSGDPPYNVPGTFGLEFYTHMPWSAALAPLRLRRIKAGMTAAARKNRIFHLWAHPHQFGEDTDAKLEFMRAILDHYATLRDRYGMESLSMSDVARRASGPETDQSDRQPLPQGRHSYEQPS